MPFVYSMNIVAVLIFIVCILIFIENRRCTVCFVGSCSNGPPCVVHYSYIYNGQHIVLIEGGDPIVFVWPVDAKLGAV